MLISDIEYYQMQCLIRFCKKKKKEQKNPQKTKKKNKQIIQLQ